MGLSITKQNCATLFSIRGHWQLKFYVHSNSVLANGGCGFAAPLCLWRPFGWTALYPSSCIGITLKWSNTFDQILDPKSPRNADVTIRLLIKGIEKKVTPFITCAHNLTVTKVIKSDMYFVCWLWNTSYITKFVRFQALAFRLINEKPELKTWFKW